MKAKNIDLDLGHYGKNLYALFKGEIDHHTAQHIRGEIDEQLYRFRPPLLVMDMGQVGFMDSSGIGLVVGRVKLAKKWHGVVRVVNVPPHLLKLFALAGLERLSGLKIEGA